MDIWFVSTFWLLQVMLPWTLIYKVLCGHMFAFLLGLYLGMKLLNHMVILCLTFWKTAKLLFTGTAPFYQFLVLHMGKLKRKTSSGLPRKAPPGLLGLLTCKKFLSRFPSRLNLIYGGHRMNILRQERKVKVYVSTQVVSLVLPTSARLALPSLYPRSWTADPKGNARFCETFFHTCH